MAGLFRDDQQRDNESDEAVDSGTEGEARPAGGTHQGALPLCVEQGKKTV